MKSGNKSEQGWYDNIVYGKGKSKSNNKGKYSYISKIVLPLGHSFLGIHNLAGACSNNGILPPLLAKPIVCRHTRSPPFKFEAGSQLSLAAWI